MPKIDDMEPVYRAYAQGYMQIDCPGLRSPDVITYTMESLANNPAVRAGVDAAISASIEQALSEASDATRDYIRQIDGYIAARATLVAAQQPVEPPSQKPPKGYVCPGG